MDDELINKAIRANLVGFFYTDVDINLIKGSSKSTSATKKYRLACKERRYSLKNQLDRILYNFEGIEEDTELPPVIFSSDNTGIANTNSRPQIQQNYPQIQAYNPLPGTFNTPGTETVLTQTPSRATIGGKKIKKIKKIKNSKLQKMTRKNTKFHKYKYNKRVTAKR